MDTARKLGELFLIGLPSPELDDESKTLLETIRPGFVILFDRNIRHADQIRKLISSIGDFLGYQPVIAIDQEGGVVTRLRDGFSVSPGAAALAQTGEIANSRIAGRILGAEMAELGIRWNLAPVADINNNHQNPGIGIRSFANEPGPVIEHAAAFLEGLNSSGVQGCLKHFPGKGRVAVDAHLDLPALDISSEELYSTELRPFREIPAAAWMPSHIYLSGYQEKREPLTVSKRILTDMVRNELGFQGVLVADDLTMGGVTRYLSPAEAVERCFAAGMDVLSVCHNSEIQTAQFEHLLKRIQTDSFLQHRLEESRARVERFSGRLAAIQKKALPLEYDYRLRSSQMFRDMSKEAIRLAKGSKPGLLEMELILAPKLSRQVRVEDPQEGIPWICDQLAKKTNIPLKNYGQKKEADFDSILAAAENKKVLLFTENAHLYEEMKAFIGKLSKSSAELFLIALRNPYDAEIETVENAVLSYGYSRPQQEALLGYLGCDGQYA